MLHENATQLWHILGLMTQVFQTLLKIAYNHCKYYQIFPPFRFSKLFK